MTNDPTSIAKSDAGEGDQRDGAFLAVLPDAVEVGDLAAVADVLAAERGQLGDSRSGLDRSQQQRTIFARLPGL